MRARLSDAEFIEKARASARRRSERQRQRKQNSGKVQANFWLPVDAKNQVDRLATELTVSPSEVATAAILAYLATPRPADSVDASQPTPANPAEFNQDLCAFKTAVTDYWHGGLQGYGQIAAALTNAGYRNSGNNPYSREAVKRALQQAGLVEKSPESKKEGAP